MDAQCNVVYKESAGSSMNWHDRPSNYIKVVVREWFGDWVVDYTAHVFVSVNGKDSLRKEIIDGDLGQAVRHGIAIFELELLKHPVLGQKDGR